MSKKRVQVQTSYLQRRGTLDPRDESLAAHLMRVRDDRGQLLPYARQWSELSVFFYAGMETTAHTIAWCAAARGQLNSVRNTIGRIAFTSMYTA